MRIASHRKAHPTGHESTPSRLRVLIVDEHEVSRAAIRALLHTEGLDVVGDVRDGRQAIALGRTLSPDVAIVDVSTDAQRAVKIARALERLPALPAVVLTSSTARNKRLDGYAFIAKPDICAQQLRLAIRPATNNSQEPTMSMQAYLDTITKQTRKSPEQFGALADKRGLLDPGVRAGQIVAWLHNDYGLGRGHAMAIVATIKQRTTPQGSSQERIARRFS